MPIVWRHANKRSTNGIALLCAMGEPLSLHNLLPVALQAAQDERYAQVFLVTEGYASEELHKSRRGFRPLKEIKRSFIDRISRLVRHYDLRVICCPEGIDHRSLWRFYRQAP